MLLLIFYARTKIKFIFFSNWATWRKPTFSANGAVFSCKVLRTYYMFVFFVRKIFLVKYFSLRSSCCKLIKLHYFTISLILDLRSWWQQLFGKTYCQQFQNEVMVSDSFGFRKTKSCTQHVFFVPRLKFEN